MPKKYPPEFKRDVVTVRDLAAEGFDGRLTCGCSAQPAGLLRLVEGAHPRRVLEDGYHTNALVDAHADDRPWACQRLLADQLEHAGLQAGERRARPLCSQQQLLSPSSQRAGSAASAALRKAELASAIFEWIEAWYNPRRRHSALVKLSRVRSSSRPGRIRGMMSTPNVSGEPGQAPLSPKGSTWRGRRVLQRAPVRRANSGRHRTPRNFPVCHSAVIVPVGQL